MGNHLELDWFSENKMPPLLSLLLSEAKLINIEFLCSCHGGIGTIINVLWDYPVASNLSLKLVPSQFHSFFFYAIILMVTFKYKIWWHRTWGLALDIVLANGCWLLWSWRNRTLFDTSFSTPSLQHMVMSRIAATFSKVTSLYGRMSKPHKMRKWICWRKPPPGWVKVKIDGASGLVDAGSLLRNEVGQWLTRFTCNIGITIVVNAKF